MKWTLRRPKGIIDEQRIPVVGDGTRLCFEFENNLLSRYYDYYVVVDDRFLPFRNASKLDNTAIRGIERIRKSYHTMSVITVYKGNVSLPEMTVSLPDYPINFRDGSIGALGFEAKSNAAMKITHTLFAAKALHESPFQLEKTIQRRIEEAVKNVGDFLVDTELAGLDPSSMLYRTNRISMDLKKEVERELSSEFGWASIELSFDVKVVNKDAILDRENAVVNKVWNLLTTRFEQSTLQALTPTINKLIDYNAAIGERTDTLIPMIGELVELTRKWSSDEINSMFQSINNTLPKPKETRPMLNTALKKPSTKKDIFI